MNTTDLEALIDREERRSDYRGDQITAVELKLISTADRERLGKLNWARALVMDLLKRIVHLRNLCRTLANAESPAPAKTGIRVHLDCEFNGGGGALISMALVSELGEFYEVVHCREPLQPWVAKNVMPILGKKPIGMSEFRNRLFAFLDQHPNFTVVVDHPADLAYFSNVLITDTKGARYDAQWSAEVQTHVNYTSKVPHNALEDARGMYAHARLR